jgi:multiple sugar transport system substrate-binding protein
VLNRFCIRLWTMFWVMIAISAVVYAAPVTVTMSLVDKLPIIPWQEEIVRRFHEKQDSIRIELVHLTTGRQDKMLTMAAAGSPLNIGYDDPPPIVSWAKRGLVRNLNPYLERDRDLFASFWPVVRELALVNGKQYGVPLELQITGLYYNADMFEEAGMKFPGGGMRWDDIPNFGPKLVKFGHDGSIERWAVQFPRWIYWWFVAWAFGADFVDDPMVPTQFIGDSQEMQTMLNLFHGMIHESRVMAPRTVSQSPQDVLMVRKNVAMALGHSNTIGFFQQIKATDGWDVARHPYGPAGNPAETHGLTWFLFEDAKHGDQAWEVLKFFSSESSLRLQMEMRGALVPHRKLAQLWMQLETLPKNRLSFIEAMETARGLPAVAAGDILSTIQGSLIPFIDGKIPLSQVLGDWRSKLPALIKDF